MSVSTKAAVSLEFTGMPIAPGVVIAPAFHFKHLDLDSLKDHGFPVENISDEIERLERAITESAEQVVKLQADTRARTGDEIAEIFQAHGALLQDDTLLSRIRSLVSEKGVNAEYVLANEIAQIESRFSTIDEEHLQVRLLDIQDVLHRLLRNLLNIEHVRSTPLRLIKSSVILVAENLLPSDLSLFELRHIAGIALEGGSAASHVAIMSRSMGVPAVFQVRGLGAIIRNGIPLILDGTEGRIVVNPSAETRALYGKKSLDKRSTASHQSRITSCRTKDGVSVSLWANAASAGDIEQAIDAGAEGIGLFRSEFYYMANGRLPTTAEETDFYRQIVGLCKGRPLTIRLLDLGADKSLPYLRQPQEQNPQLGLRGIRLLLMNPEMMRNHITAIIRASMKGEIRLLIPFVSYVEEVAAVRSLVSEIARSEGADASHIAIGMMVEIPAVVISLETFLPSVDFLSIGSNDLMQYTFALDRDHAGLEKYRRNAESMVCRIAENIATRASRAGKPVAVCGEMAGDPRCASMLVGLGITALSMQPDSIGPVRDAINRRVYGELKEEARQFITSPLDGALFA
jgi:phosphoenolpyruvate-protein phosphotransferase (PTS system enzyme I)